MPNPSLTEGDNNEKENQNKKRPTESSVSHHPEKKVKAHCRIRRRIAFWRWCGDRGGGLVYVDGGTYTSNGLGSPAIYSTAEIHVSGATLVSNLSEGVCIEGKNSIELTDCDLVANNTKCNGNATFYDTIMI